VTPGVERMLQKEKEAGITMNEYYQDFQSRVDQIKYSLLDFLLKAKKDGKGVIGYGAAAKGNTLLNYAGIKGNDLISFVVDAAPSKVGKYLPGSHIPVYDQSKIRETKPDYIIILPWNLKEEITEQLSYVRAWGGRFVVFVPELEILEAQEVER
jgi:hypothetical protein